MRLAARIERGILRIMPLLELDYGFADCPEIWYVIKDSLDADKSTIYGWGVCDCRTTDIYRRQADGGATSESEYYAYLTDM